MVILDQFSDESKLLYAMVLHYPSENISSLMAWVIMYLEIQKALIDIRHHSEPNVDTLNSFPNPCILEAVDLSKILVSIIVVER